MSRTSAETAAIRDLAAVLAQGYRRLTQKARNVAISCSKNLDKDLDVLPQPEELCDRESA